MQEINNLKSYDDKDFDRLELKNQEIQDTIMDVVRVAKTSEKEGNQWKAEYQAQVEENARIGQDILRMTDKIEQIKGYSSQGTCHVCLTVFPIIHRIEVHLHNYSNDFIQENS